MIGIECDADRKLEFCKKEKELIYEKYWKVRDIYLDLYIKLETASFWERFKFLFTRRI